MGHEITRHEGKDLFVYNRQNGHPWHTLGTPFERYMQLAKALELSGSDDTVYPVTLTAVTPNGIEEVEDTIGMWSDKYGLIKTGMSPDYVPKQRREIAELAYAIVGLDPDAAQIDTMGNLGERAQRFFTYIKVPNLVIDPNGIADVIERGLTAATSFDGSLPNTIFYTDIRVVCANTLRWGMAHSKDMIRVKHTKHSEERIIEAARALEYIGIREKDILEKAERMLKVKGEPALDKVADYLFPLGESVDDKTKTRRVHHREELRFLYDGNGNLSSGLVGRNGWAAFNAGVEWLDHFRPIRGKSRVGERRAEAAVLPGKVSDEKQRLAELILN